MHNSCTYNLRPNRRHQHHNAQHETLHSSSSPTTHDATTDLASNPISTNSSTTTTLAIDNDDNHARTAVALNPTYAPHHYIGRRVLVDCEDGVYPGVIISSLPGDQEFNVQYDFDQGEQIFAFAEIKAIILPIVVTTPGTNNFYTSNDWKYCKKTYSKIRNSLFVNSFSFSNRIVLSQLFGFRRDPLSITPARLKSKLNKLATKWHSDKIGLNAPLWVIYVTKYTLLALRYLKERFSSMGMPDPESTIDEPVLADFPEYGSENFLQKCGCYLGPNPTLSQDDENLAADNPSSPPHQPNEPGHNNPPDEANNNPTTSDDNNNTWNYVDTFPMDDFFLSPFETVGIIPFSLADKWAKAYARTTKHLINAAESSNDADKNNRIATSLKWYAALPQLFFRDTGRDPKRAHRIFEMRLDQFIAGLFTELINRWRTDRDKILKKPPRKVKCANPAKAAVNLVYQGFISRATGLIEGFGRTSCDSPAIRQQMLDKHPQVIDNWNHIPPRDDGEDAINFSQMDNVIRDLDPHVGVGPRALHSDYIFKLLGGRMTDPESRTALQLFKQLGTLYLNCTLPTWARKRLGSGLLTPLNKSMPTAEGLSDARPVNAEDSDTSVWCKSLQRAITPNVRSAVSPQQLGVGVSGGVELFTLGLKLKYEEAVRLGLNRVICKIDLKNAHNSFSRKKVNEKMVLAVANDPTLAPLLLSLQATIGSPTPIYTRTALTSAGISYLCNSCQGGPQGNALTGLSFTMVINPSLKSVESNFPGVEVRAIQDDISLFGDPDIIFGEDGALDSLLKSLREEAGCTPQLTKLKALGTLPESCQNMPNYIERPCVQYEDPATGTVAYSFGLEVCGAPIGEDIYVLDWLSEKGTSIASTISTTSAKLAALDLQVAQTVLTYSLQNRSDYIMATNLPSNTSTFAASIDNATRNAYKMILGSDLLLETGHDTAIGEDPSFTRDRFLLKASRGGGGYRPIGTHRASFLNCFNTIAHQCLNTENNGHRGLWHSLDSIFGSTSFSETNSSTKWHFFFNSGSQYGLELKSEWLRLQQARTTLINSMPEPLPSTPDSPLTSPPESFGVGSTKLHKSVFDSLQNLRTTNIKQRAKLLNHNDPRRISYLSTYDDKFCNSLMKASPIREIKFSHNEFLEAISSHFGIPSLTCHSIVGETITNHANCGQLRVDKYGYNLKTITGSTGDQTRSFHDNIVASLSSSLTSAAIPHRGGPYRTCKGLFSHLISQNLSDSNERHLQGIIPDLLVDATKFLSATTEESMYGKITLLDVKTLSPGQAYTEHSNLISNAAVERRASAVNTQYHSHARQLDEDLNNTPIDQTGPIERELNTYGNSGKVLGCIVGAFGECSRDIYSLRDIIAHCQATAHMDYMMTSYSTASAIYKQRLTKHWGLTFARGWARLLLQRRRDLVGSHAGMPCQSSSGQNGRFQFPDDSDAYARYNHQRHRHHYPHADTNNRT